MTSPLLLGLAVFIGACTEIAGHYGISVQRAKSLGQTEKMQAKKKSQEYFTQITNSFKLCYSVHSLTPGHISRLHLLGIPPSQRTEGFGVANQLLEIVARFNPLLKAKPPLQLRPGNFLKKPQDLATILSQEEDDWQVLVVFVPGDTICPCSTSVEKKIKHKVQQVERALKIFQKTMRHTLVHLAVWSGPLDVDMCNCKGDEVKNPFFQKAATLEKLQNCLSNLVENPTWDNKGLSFTVAMHPSPVIVEMESRCKDAKKQQGDVALQLWKSILQPSGTDGLPVGFPCPILEGPFLRTVVNTPRQEAPTPRAKMMSLQPVDKKTSRLYLQDSIPLRSHIKTEPFIRPAYNTKNNCVSTTPAPAAAANWGSDFTCVNTAPSDSVPTSAHKVRPADIKVVSAVGDFFTTGFGAKSKGLSDMRTEYRGVSWSIGGDETLDTVTTLPNILKKFNPNLKGMSFGVGKDQTGFNIASSAAKISCVPGQIRSLIRTMKADRTVDFEKDWKLVTIHAGANDLCHYCKDPGAYSPKNYSRHLMASLDTLYAEVPRVIVNVVELMDMEELFKLRKNNPECHSMERSECPCFDNLKEGSPEFAKMIQVNDKIQDETRKLLLTRGRYFEREDFAANLVSFAGRSPISPEVEKRAALSLLSPDCFHLSERGQAEMALALWREMIGFGKSPQGSTNRHSVRCPTRTKPFITTWVNLRPKSRAHSNVKKAGGSGSCSWSAGRHRQHHRHHRHHRPRRPGGAVVSAAASH